MSSPTKFPQANIGLLKPENMTHAECGTLPAFTDKRQFVSCWKLTPEEIKEVSETGVVWLTILGQGHPPVAISGFDPFTPVQDGTAQD